MRAKPEPLGHLQSDGIGTPAVSTGSAGLPGVSPQWHVRTNIRPGGSMGPWPHVEDSLFFIVRIQRVHTTIFLGPLGVETVIF